MKCWLRIGQLAGGDGKHRPEAGYTITEVMVVLAVSAVMFSAIVLAFSGRQGRVEFSQSVRDYEAQLQSVMNEVATGYYQSNLKCTLDGGGNPSISSAVTADAGTNSACIFAGKVVVPDRATGDASMISTLVGRRVVGTRDVETLAEAKPVVAKSFDKSFRHSFGIKVRQIQNIDKNTRLYGLGFMNQLARGTLPTGGDVAGGEGLIKLYGLTSPTLAGGDSIVNPSHLVLLPKGAVLCLEGHNGQFAEVTIGENNSNSTITSTLDTAKSGEKCRGL